MPSLRVLFLSAAAAGVVGFSAQGLAQTSGVGQANADVVGELSSNEGIFVDGKTFKIAKGKAKGDPMAKLTALGAKEVGPGAIIFRQGDKLFIVEAATSPAPQAMKSFQDEWANSYMKAFKEFQDHWAVSYMKTAQAAPGVSAKDITGMDSYKQAMKNFQDEWAVSYMNAMKNFQDQWAVGYMKNFQDHWAVSYMNSVKNFQDTFATMYMK